MNTHKRRVHGANEDTHMTVTRNGNTLDITGIELHAPTPSSTGKTDVIVGGAPMKTSATWTDGRTITVNVLAWLPRGGLASVGLAEGGKAKGKK